MVQEYNKLGAYDIERHVLFLVDYFYNQVEKELKNIHINGRIPPSNRSNLLSIIVPEQAELTDEKMMEHRVRAHCFKNGTIFKNKISLFQQL